MGLSCSAGDAADVVEGVRVESERPASGSASLELEEAIFSSGLGVLKREGAFSAETEDDADEAEVEVEMEADEVEEANSFEGGTP